MLLEFILHTFFHCLIVVQQQDVPIWFDHAKAKMAELSFPPYLNFDKFVFISHQKHQFSVCLEPNGDAKVQTHLYDGGHERLRVGISITRWLAGEERVYH